MNPRRAAPDHEPAAHDGEIRPRPDARRLANAAPEPTPSGPSARPGRPRPGGSSPIQPPARRLAGALHARRESAPLRRRRAAEAPPYLDPRGSRGPRGSGVGLGWTPTPRLPQTPARLSFDTLRVASARALNREPRAASSRTLRQCLAGPAAGFLPWPPGKHSTLQPTLQPPDREASAGGRLDRGGPEMRP